jgi:hypothetical protein
MGEFASLLRDVKANKGVLISTSGFTAAAIEMAKAQGISTRTYLDTEDVDWRSEVTIPVLLERTQLESWRVRFSTVPGFPWCVPTNVPFPLIETFAEDHTPLGPVITLFGKAWNHNETLHEPGTHIITLADHVLVKIDGEWCPTKMSAELNVQRRYYLGSLPVKMQGFRDERSGSLITNSLTTDRIEPAKIERGEVPGWTEVGISDDLAVTVMMRMGYIDAVPENAKEMEAFKLP